MDFEEYFLKFNLIVAQTIGIIDPPLNIFHYYLFVSL